MKTIYRCQDCEWVNNPKQCSNCGAICFADETPEEQARERVRDAAPELLAALDWITTFCEEHEEWFGAEDGAEGEWFTIARAAIDRAKGGQ